MNIIYHANVENGIVVDVRRVVLQRIMDNPDLYPGQWVEISSMDQYPAVGWYWDDVNGFQEPSEPIIEDILE